MEIVGGGSNGFLCEQPDIQMDSFFVNVTVDLPDVIEVYTYFLFNPTNKTINQEVIIPLCFDEYTFDYYTIEQASLFVDGVKIEYSNGSVELDEIDMVIDLPEISGITATIDLLPNKTTNVTLQLHREFDDYTESFLYVYSAKTARYWNGTINHGHFFFEYLSQYENITYEGPNGTVNGNEISSIMKNWDGDANYRVIVDTGIRYQRSNIFFYVQFIIILTVAVCVSYILVKAKKK